MFTHYDNDSQQVFCVLVILKLNQVWVISGTRRLESRTVKKTFTLLFDTIIIITLLSFYECASHSLGSCNRA